MSLTFPMLSSKAVLTILVNELSSRSLSQNEPGFGSAISCDNFEQESPGVHVGWPVVLGIPKMHRPCESLPLNTL